MINAENKSHITEDVCFYATVDNHPWAYLFDCGMGRYLGAGDCKAIGAVFVTHTHIDHFSNFDTVLRHQLGLERPVIICGPRGIARNVQGRVLSYTWNLVRRKRPLTYEVRELEDNRITVYRTCPPKWSMERVEEIRPVDRVCFRGEGVFARYEILDHKIPSIAYLLEEDSKLNIGEFPFRPGPWVSRLKEAYLENDPERGIDPGDGNVMRAGELFQYLYVKKGGRFGFAMDHLACQSNRDKLISLWKDADEVVVEAFFRECDRSYAMRHFHSTVAESGITAKLAGVKKVRFAHHSRRYSGEIPDLVEEGLAAFEGRDARFSSAPVSRYGGDEDLDE